MAIGITTHSNESKYQQDLESATEKGLAGKHTAVVTEEVTSPEDPELRPGHRIHYGAAVIDVLISLLPLYFIVFGLLANARDGTLATSFRSLAILKMATLVRDFHCCMERCMSPLTIR